MVVLEPAAAAKKFIMDKKRTIKEKNLPTDEPPDKIAKLTETLYTSTAFKFELRDVLTAFTAMKNFVESATNYPNVPEKYDIVSNYCELSNECEEVLRHLNTSKTRPQNMATVFDVLRCILIRIADDLTVYKKLGVVIVQKILTIHLEKLQHFLTNSKATHVKSGLKLLTAIVVLGENNAKNVLNKFEFDNHSMIRSMLERRDMKDEQDVRTCFFHFISSFFITRSDNVICQLVNEHSILGMMFEGMQVDKSAVLKLFLPIILEKIIKNELMNKSLKVKLFSATKLTQLAKLYNWLGPSHWKKVLKEKIKIEQTENSEDQDLIRKCVHELLLELVTSPKNGIIFFDKTFGTSGRDQNHAVRLFLQDLHVMPFLDDSLIQDLIVKLFQACPEQIHPFLSQIQNSTIPKSSLRWLKCMEFLGRILEVQPDIPSPLKTFRKFPVEKLVELVLMILVPSLDIIQNVCQGLVKKELYIRHASLQYIFTLVKKLSCVFNYCIDGSFLSNNTVYCQSEIEKFQDLFTTEVNRLLPNVMRIYECWTKLEESQKTEETKSEEKPEASQQIIGIPEVDPIAHVILIEQTLCVYQSMFPSALSDSSVIIGGVMDNVQKLSQSWKQQQQQTPDTNNSVAAAAERKKMSRSQIKVKMYFLKILAEADARKIQWTKKNDDKHSQMYLLLDMLMSISNEPQLLSVTKSLICQLLYRTGLFEGLKSELQIWLDCLVRCGANQDNSDLLEFVSNLLTVYISNPYPYVDKVIDILSKASTLETTADINSTVNMSTVDAVIENLADFDEKAMELADSGPVESNNDKSSFRLPFSPLIVTAIELTKKMSETECASLKRFLPSVLLDLFHSQTNPLALCVLFTEDSIKDISWMKKKTLSYIKSWLPNSKMAEKKKDINLEEIRQEKFPVLFQIFYQMPRVSIGNEDFLTMLFGSVNSLDRDETFRALQQNMLYIQVMLSRYEKEHIADDKIKKVLQLYFKILKRILKLLFKKAQKEDYESSLGDISVAAEDFQILQIERVTFHHLSIQVMDLLSTQSALQKWFLFNPNNKYSAEPVEADSQTISFLRELVTVELTEVFCLFPKVINKNSKILPEIYNLKILPFLKNCCLQITKNNNADNESLSLILNNLNSLMYHLDFATIQDVVELLLQFPKKTLASKNDLTTSGESLVKFLNHLLSSNESLRLEITSVNAIFSLLQSEGLDSLMAVCKTLFLSKPYFCLACPSDVFKHFLTTASPKHLELAIILMKFNTTLDQVFVSWILEKGVPKDNLESYLEVCTYWCMYQRTLPEGNIKLCLSKISKIYRKYLSGWMENMEKEPQNQTCNENCLKLLQQLTRLHASGSKHMLSLKSFKEKKEVLSLEQLQSFLLVAQWLDKNNSNSVEIFSCRLEVCLKCFVDSVNMKVGDSQDKMFESHLLSLLEKYLTNLPHKHYNVLKAVWTAFVRSALRCYYSDPRLLRLLACVIPTVYHNAAEAAVSPGLLELYQMVMCHSEFMTIMMEGADGPTKELLLDLILVILELKPECCAESHLNILFGAYGASLSTEDQKLLKIIHLYEKNGISFSQFKPYMWGVKGMEFYALSKGLDATLDKAPSVRNVLEILDSNKMIKSILHFPIERKLSPANIEPADELKSLTSCYDPSFLLPVFSHLLASENHVRCLHFIEKRCFGYCIAALSSHDSNLRAAAYHVLFRFIDHLETTQFHRKDQFLYLLKFLKNSIVNENTRLPCTITIYLSRVSQILINEGHELYLSITSPLIVKPHLDINAVPQFFRMFNSFTIQHHRERMWILYLLYDGLRESTDHKLYQKFYVFKIIMSFANSSLCDSGTQVQVLRILKRACAKKKTAYQMTRYYGILTWINSFISNVNPHSQIIVLVTELLHNLWFTLLLKSKAPQVDEDKHQESSSYLLPMPFLEELQILLLNLLEHYRESSAYAAMKSFLPLFSSLLEYKKMVVLHSKGKKKLSKPKEELLDKEDKSEEECPMEEGTQISEVEEERDTNESLDISFRVTSRDILLLLFQSRQHIKNSCVSERALDMLKLSGYTCDHLTEAPKSRKFISDSIAAEKSHLVDSERVGTTNEKNRETDNLCGTEETAAACSEEEQKKLLNDLVNICLVWVPSAPDEQSTDSVFTQTLTLVISWLSHEASHLLPMSSLNEILLWIHNQLTKWNFIMPAVWSKTSNQDSVGNLPENLLSLYGRILNEKIPNSIHQTEFSLVSDSMCTETILKSQKLLAELCRILQDFHVEKDRQNSINKLYLFLSKITTEFST